MTILTVIQLALAALQSVLGVVTKTPAYGEVVSEIQAAIAALEGAQQKVVTLGELEDLRTKPIW